MISELIYTSSPTGLKPGAKGFCVVAATKGIPEMLVKQLEAMSGYRHLVTPTEGPKAGNPINWMHLRQSNGNSILARVSDAGLDYSGRTNKLAQFMVVPADSRMASGPSNLLRGNNWLDRWEGEARTLPHRGQMDSSDSPTGPCSCWKQTAGDAGWAGVIAEAVATRNSKDWNLIYRPGIDCLRLVDEAIGLLPESLRWNVTFATYFTGSCTNQLPCQWRFIVAGSKEHDAIRNAHSNVIDLTNPKPCEHVSKWVDAARSGVMVEMPKPAAAATRPTTVPSSLPLSRGVQSGSALQSYDMQATDEHRVWGTSAASPGDFQLNERYGPPNQPTPHRNFAKKKSTPVALIASIAAVIALMIGGVIGAGGMAAIQSNDTLVANANLALLTSEAAKGKLETEKKELVETNISKLEEKKSELTNIKSELQTTSDELTKIKSELKTISDELTKIKSDRDTAKAPEDKPDKNRSGQKPTIENPKPTETNEKVEKPPKEEKTPRVRFETFSLDKKYKLNERKVKKGTIVELKNGAVIKKTPDLEWDETFGFIVKAKSDSLGRNEPTTFVKLISGELRAESSLPKDSFLWIEFVDEDGPPTLLWNQNIPELIIGLDNKLSPNVILPIPGLIKDALGKAAIIRVTWNAGDVWPPPTIPPTIPTPTKTVSKKIEARNESVKFTQTIDIMLDANGMTVITSNQRNLHLPPPPNASPEVKAQAAAFPNLLTVTDIVAKYSHTPIVVRIEFPKEAGLKDLDGKEFAMQLNFEFFLDLEPKPNSAANTGSPTPSPQSATSQTTKDGK